MMKSTAISAALIASVALPAAGMAQSLSPAKVFDGNTTIPTKSGTAQTVHLDVEMWRISGERGENGSAQEIPLRGFYVAHLLSGDVSATIDGQVTRHQPGGYWPVRAGATMQVKASGHAVLETIVLTKQ
jgi:quercetin dioxygenase-like cupin family protein